MFYFRDGTEKVFKDLDKHNIPILVFSAGLGDCIVAVLQHFNVLYPAVKVRLIFNLFHTHYILALLLMF